MYDYDEHSCLNANFVFYKIKNDKTTLPCTTTLQITTPLKISNRLAFYALSYSVHKIKAARRPPPAARPSVMVMTIPLAAKG